MIQCTIDGKIAYPDTKNKIKITFENQYIKDSGEYTYQISFPMSILENRKVFSNIHRIDVSKKTLTFEECVLMADNHRLVSGKGIVIGVTQDAVKLQIVGGKSRIKYNSKFEQHYIDEMSYHEVVIDTDQTIAILSGRATLIRGLAEFDLRNTEVFGAKGIYAFNPVYDETNDSISNQIISYHEKAYVYNLAVQPYLFYILRQVLAQEGYTLSRNDFDVDPWNRLVICSARHTLDIAKALPHWTVYTFLDELRKLFNGTFVFNERLKTVDFMAHTEAIGSTTAVRECLDEYSSEYDEDGLQNLAISNVEYVLAESANRDMWEIIPQEVIDKFPMIEADHWWEFPEQTAKEDRCSIFKINSCGHEIIVEVEDEDTGQLRSYFTLAMAFNPLVRDSRSDDFEKLHISPVAMTYCNRWNPDSDEDKLFRQLDRLNFKIFVPSIVNDKEKDLNSYTFDEDKDEYYVSVQDAIEDTDLIKDQEEDKDEIMQVMFQGKRTYNYVKKILEDPEHEGPSDTWYRRHPINFTDARAVYYHIFGYGVDADGQKRIDSASLALISFPCIDCIGDFASNVEIDKHNTVCLKFPAKDIPDPSAIYIFRNKKFLCQKIEFEVSENGIDEIKTGYFYEIKS